MLIKHNAFLNTFLFDSWDMKPLRPMPSHFCQILFIEQSGSNNLQNILESCCDGLVSLVKNRRNNLNQQTPNEALNRVDSVFDWSLPHVVDGSYEGFFYVFQSLSDEYRSSVFMKNYKSNLIHLLLKIKSRLKNLETSKVGKFSLTNKVHVF